MEDTMEIKKNQEFEVVIEDLTAEGEGIGKVDGFPFFIKDTVIGDRVRIRVVKQKKAYGYGRMMELLSPSQDRIPPRCPIARQCGGCTLQAMSYPKQLEFKRNKVENHLKRIGGLKKPSVLPVIGMDEPWRYRNKAQIPVGYDKNGQLIAGFYAGRTHDIISCRDCQISPEKNARILDIILQFMNQNHIAPYCEENGSGLVRHILIREGRKTGEVMVCLILNGRKLSHADELVTRLCTVSGMTSISINVNEQRTNVILGTEILPLYGEPCIHETIGGITYRLSPLSFFQVNPVQTEILYRTALSFAGLSGEETVWDLYCGTGSISLFLAQKAKQVYGVEIVPAAIEDAKRNAKNNQIDNAEFFVGRAEEVLPEQYHRNQIYADVIVLDPPRKGCEESLLETILQMAPKRVVYVSCDSATLARDLKYLCSGGEYRVEKVQPVDLFPWTGHVECVVLMTKVQK